MWLTLLDFKIADEALSREMGITFLTAYHTEIIVPLHDRDP
jgi:hypothetical protein